MTSKEEKEKDTMETCNLESI